MCCYAGKLLQQPEMNNPTLVVVTDRNNLDGQLYQQFCSARELLKQTPEQAEDRDDLRARLTPASPAASFSPPSRSFRCWRERRFTPLYANEPT